MSQKRPLVTPGTMDDERPRHPDTSQNMRETVRSPRDFRKNEVRRHMKKLGMRIVLDSVVNLGAKIMESCLQTPWFKHSRIARSLEFYTQLQ